MRRLFVVVSVLAALVVVPTGRAEAAAAGACLMNAAEAYQIPLPPVVTTQAPTINATPVNMNLQLNCLGLGGALWAAAGQGLATTVSCVLEAGTAQLFGPNVAANAIWVRAGLTGWMAVSWQSPSTPGTNYAYEGPFAWQPQGDCITQPVHQATLAGAGPFLGLL